MFYSLHGTWILYFFSTGTQVYMHHHKHAIIVKYCQLHTIRTYHRRFTLTVPAGTDYTA